jgi:hypothetical protein
MKEKTEKKKNERQTYQPIEKTAQKQPKINECRDIISISLFLWVQKKRQNT